MSYYFTDRLSGLGADPGCAEVRYKSASGYDRSGQVCPTGASCGMGPDEIRTILQASGYPCDGLDCRLALQRFRTDRALPRGNDRGDLIASDCVPFMNAWKAWSQRQPQVQPEPTPLPRTGTATPRLAAASSVRQKTAIKSTMASAATAKPVVEAEGFWSSLTTVQKGLIIGGGVAVLGAGVYFATRKGKS